MRVAKDSEKADYIRRMNEVDNPEGIKQDSAKSKPIANIVKDLETTNYLDNLIKECSHKFYDPAF